MFKWSLGSFVSGLLLWLVYELTREAYWPYWFQFFAYFGSWTLLALGANLAVASSWGRLTNGSVTVTNPYSRFALTNVLGALLGTIIGLYLSHQDTSRILKGFFGSIVILWSLISHLAFLLGVGLAYLIYKKKVLQKTRRV